MQVKNTKKRFYALLLNAILFLITLPFRLFSFSAKSSITSPKSFLIIRLDHIGDVVLSTPVYHSLKDKFPEAQITVLCGSWGKSILENNPYIDSLIILDCPWWTSIRSDVNKKSNFLRRLFITLKQIHSKKFDVCIELRGDIRHIFLFGWLPNIPCRIAFTRSGGSFLLTHPLPYQTGKHEIERNNQLISFFEPISKYWKTEVYTNISDDTKLTVKLSEKISIATEPFVVIFNGGRSNLRRLSTKKVADLCSFIIHTYAIKCCFIGQQSDYENGEEVRGFIHTKKKIFEFMWGTYPS